nr:hypothetical protein [Tanacetum cinerariifolium]
MLSLCIRCPTDESICYRYILDVQRMSGYVIVFQRLARYPISVRAFDDPILFLVALQSLWEHGEQRPAIFMGDNEMSFRNFIYIEDDEDLTFLPKDFSVGFNIGSPSVSINTEPVRADEQGNPKGDTFVVHAGSVAARIREKKCKTRRGSSRPPVRRNLAFSSLTSRIIRAKASPLKDDTPVLSIYDDDKGLEDYLELKDATACHLKIFAITPPIWKGCLNNHLDMDLLDLYDHCYARQAVVDNEVNRRSRELLEVIKKMRGEADVMLMLESQKWLGYQVSLLDLESKVTSLEAEKANLKATDASLRQETVEVKHDRKEVVSKVARMKKAFDLLKVKGYRLSYEKEHTQSNNDLATAAFSWLNAYVVDAFASVKDFLSKKPPTLQKLVPSRT